MRKIKEILYLKWGRREAVRGLCQADGSGCRSKYRRDPRGTDLRDSARGFQIYLCRGHLESEPARLDRLAPTSLYLSGWGPGDRGARQPAIRRQQGATARQKASIIG